MKSGTLVAIFTTYWFELGIAQYTVFAIGLLRYVLIRGLVFFGIDRF